MPDLAIDAERLGRRYGRRWALADVSMQIPAGSVTMVAGANGSGKTTLFRLLATAIRPDLGRGRVLGFDLVRERDDIRTAVALLSHHSYLYESLTGRENLQIVAGHGIDATLERVGLAARAADPVSTYSAGMRRRLSFARVLLQEPRLMLLDEPYAQLDPAGFDLVDAVVREMNERGVTILITTHQTERTSKIADFAIDLDGGRLQSFRSING